MERPTPKRLTLFLVCLAFVLVLFVALQAESRVQSLEGQITALRQDYNRLAEDYTDLEAKAEADKAQSAEVERELWEEIKGLQEKKLDAPSRGGERRSDVNTMDLRKPSGVTAAQIDSVFSTRLQGLGRACIIAERVYGVNAAFLAAIVIHESGNGSSRIAKEKNNLVGFAAYTSRPFASARSFATQDESIYALARLLSSKYLDPEGRYFEGYRVKDINAHYAEDKGWYRDVGAWMTRIMEVN
jgi:beta-N-acetylglucosaminidase